MSALNHNKWLTRQAAYWRYYHRFDNRQKCVAVCVFNLDYSETRIPASTFARLIGISKTAMNTLIKKMDYIAYCTNK